MESEVKMAVLGPRCFCLLLSQRIVRLHQSSFGEAELMIAGIVCMPNSEARESLKIMC